MPQDSSSQKPKGVVNSTYCIHNTFLTIPLFYASKIEIPPFSCTAPLPIITLHFWTSQPCAWNSVPTRERICKHVMTIIFSKPFFPNDHPVLFISTALQLWNTINRYSCTSIRHQGYVAVSNLIIYFPRVPLKYQLPCKLCLSTNVFRAFHYRRFLLSISLRATHTHPWLVQPDLQPFPCKQTTRFSQHVLTLWLNRWQ